jgi:aspartyl/asparaginyl beta-hydroxylase (cupin superfamily)
MDNQTLQTLAQRGFAAFQGENFAEAHALFGQIVAAGAATPPIWYLHADAAFQLGHLEEAEASLTPALAADPANIPAIVLKADLYSKRGEDRNAIAWYQRAIDLANTAQGLSPTLLSRVAHAKARRRVLVQGFETHLFDKVAEAGIVPEALDPRFAESLAILTGRQQPFYQEPKIFNYPGLPQIAFYDTAQFDWVEALEAAYPALRAEALAALESGEGASPYVQVESDLPDRTHALTNNRSWSAYRFWENGQFFEKNAARCTETMKAIGQLPLPFIKDRSPMAIFSILEPHTHIPPHNGMLNTRLICHLPLIVPENCRLRVGNHMRTVEEGKMLIFDDSIEHEAWNDSDDVRVILLFEIWRPELSADEVKALTALYEAVNLYPQSGSA